MRFERHPGLHLAYELHGQGDRAVVCVPGMGDLAAQYRALIPGLVAAGCRVVTLDLRGHGASDTGFSRYDPAAVGGDVLALMDHLGLATAVVVGNSAAAASAVWAAAEAPERVGGLVLLGPVVRNPASWSRWMLPMMTWLFAGPWGPWMWRLFYRTRYATLPSDHAAHEDAVVAAVRGRVAAALENGMADKTPCADRIPQVEAPTLVVMGSADPDFPDAVAEADEVGAALGAQVVHLAGVGHYPHLEAPDATSEAVVAFLGRQACHAAV